MLDLFNRSILFHELNLKREPEHAPRIELVSLIPPLVQRIERKEAVKVNEKKTSAVRVTDVKEFVKEQVIVLLFQYADTQASAPVFSHLDSGELREEPLLDGEGVAVSAHVAISLKPKQPHAPLYDFLVEQVPGLGRSRMTPFLKSTLKMVAEGMFEWKDETENNRKRSYKPAVEVAPIACVTLRDEIDRGSVISELELISHKPFQKFDEPDAFEEKRHSVFLKVVSNDGILGKLNELKALARKSGYTELKLHYKNEGGKQKTALMGTTKQDVADSLLGRTEEVTADEPLAQCRPAVCESIARKMVAFIVDARS